MHQAAQPAHPADRLAAQGSGRFCGIVSDRQQLMGRALGNFFQTQEIDS